MTTAASTPTLPAALGQLGPGAGPDDVYTAFAAWVTAQGIELYPAQDEALIELVSGAHVILGTPTGSGKSLVATGAHAAALAAGRRSVYTAPIKALVSEKFFALCRIFGAGSVGMLTGDATVNAGAPIVCATAEVLANHALRHGAATEFGTVIMDEFHYYGDPDRGWAWQVPLLEMPHSQFLLMSATLGDVTDLAADLSARTGRPTAVVASAHRPVPLHHYYSLTPMHETIAELLGGRQAPVYVVHFTQAAALEQAQALASVPVASRAEKDLIAAQIGDFRFARGFGTTLSRLVRMGIGVHHAGMLPKYRRLVEQLAQAGLLKVICGTDTLGVGINVPIRTVVFASLAKYDGHRTRHLQAREFHQIAGRAGRAGYDTAGTVVVQAPEHEIENARLLARAGDDEKKRRRVVRKKPPEGTVSWTRATFDRLEAAAPEPLTPHLRVTHSMLLNIVARPGNPVEAVRRLIVESHEPPAAQRHLIRSALRAYRALLAAGVIERLAAPDPDGRTIRLTGDLPDNFALNQPLSTFALAAAELLDTDSEDFALDVVSVVEATLDQPRQVLSAQLNHARGEAVAQMKAEGMDYEDRIAALDQITYPQPLGELLHAAYATYARGHPWLLEFELTPKSVVRDMWQRAMTFTEYVSFYGLSRSEGTLLRYLTDAYRALRSGVPAFARTEPVEDIVAWLGELVRQVDSSLLDEWDALTHPTDVAGAEALPPAPRRLTDNVRAFTVLVRNALFRRVELFALRRYTPLGELDGASGWTAPRWAEAIEAYFGEYDRLGTGAAARGADLVHIDRGESSWTVRQVFDDPEQDRDWGITAEVDLAASDESGQAELTVVAVGPFA